MPACCVSTLPTVLFYCCAGKEHAFPRAGAFLLPALWFPRSCCAPVCLGRSIPVCVQCSRGKEQLDPPAAVQACKSSGCLVRRPFPAPSSQQQLACSWWRESICSAPHTLSCDFTAPVHSAYRGKCRSLNLHFLPLHCCIGSTKMFRKSEYLYCFKSLSY